QLQRVVRGVPGDHRAFATAVDEYADVARRVAWSAQQPHAGRGLEAVIHQFKLARAGQRQDVPADVARLHILPALPLRAVDDVTRIGEAGQVGAVALGAVPADVVGVQVG